jgi:hypothetical protein
MVLLESSYEISPAPSNHLPDRVRNLLWICGSVVLCRLWQSERAICESGLDELSSVDSKLGKRNSG